MRVVEALRSLLSSKKRWLGLGALLFAGVLIVPGIAFAEDPDPGLISYGIAFFVSILTTVLSYVLSAIGQLILLIIEALLIPILQYNEFASSKIIGIGWSLVRDVMNMFVVVILIVVSIFTILNMKRANWEQNLKNLFLAVVLMNFSRTICGFFIDVSQVVMLTFVNALLDIAAGNFAQMFGLNSFGSFTERVNQGGADATAQFISVLAQIPLYVVIFGVILSMAVAFLYRIIVLWILVIMSPYAFFADGVKDVLPGIAKGAGQWWSKFNGALLLGPILSFFLWLALSISSSGNLLEAEGFKTPSLEDQSYVGFLVESLEVSNIGGTMIAIVLLVVGMGIAAEQAKALGGLAASWITEGWAKKLATVGTKGAAWTGERMVTNSIGRLAGVAGYGAAGGIGYGLGKAGFTNAQAKFNNLRDGSANLAKNAPRADEYATRAARWASSGAGGVIGSVAGATGSTTLASAAGYVAGYSKRSNDAQRAAAKKRIDSMTDEEKLARLRAIENDKLPSDLEGQEIAGLLRGTFVKDKGLQKKYGDKFNTDEVDSKKKLLSTSIDTLSKGNAENQWMDNGDLDKQKHKLFHLLSTEEQEKFMASDAFNPANISQDALDELHKSTTNEGKRVYQALLDVRNDKGEKFGDRLRDKKVQGLIAAEESIEKKKSKGDREKFEKDYPPKERTAAELDTDMAKYMAAAVPLLADPRIASAIGAQKTFASSGDAAQVSAMHGAAMKWAATSGRTEKEIEAAIQVGAIRADLLTDSDFSGASGSALAAALAKKGGNTSEKMANDTVRNAYHQTVQRMTSGLDSSNVDHQATAVTIATSDDRKLLASMTEDQRTALHLGVNAARARGAVSTKEYGKAMANIIANEPDAVTPRLAPSGGASTPLEVIFSGVNVSSHTTLDLQNRQAEIGAAVKARPEIARHFEKAIDTSTADLGARANEASRLIVQAVSKDMVTKLSDQMSKASKAGDAALEAQLKKALEVIKQAAFNEANSTSRGNDKQRNRANDLLEHAETLESL